MENKEVKNIFFQLVSNNVKKPAILQIFELLKEFGFKAFDIDVMPLPSCNDSLFRFRVPVEYAKRYVDILQSLNLHFMAYNE